MLLDVLISISHTSPFILQTISAVPANLCSSDHTNCSEDINSGLKTIGTEVEIDANDVETGVEIGANDVGTDVVNVLNEGGGQHGPGPQASSSLHINEKLAFSNLIPLIFAIRSSAFVLVISQPKP